MDLVPWSRGDNDKLGDTPAIEKVFGQGTTSRNSTTATQQQYGAKSPADQEAACSSGIVSSLGRIDASSRRMDHRGSFGYGLYTNDSGAGFYHPRIHEKSGCCC